MIGRAASSVMTIGADIRKNDFCIIGLDVRVGSRLCENDFLETETKY
jgi:hypothetical protein